MKIKDLTREELAKLPAPFEEKDIDSLLIEDGGDYDSEHWRPDRFRVDFTRPWLQFPPNASARRVFVKHLMQSVRRSIYTIAPKLYNEADITEAIDRHIPHVKKKYKEAMAKLDPVAGDAKGRRAAQNSRKSTVCSLMSDLFAAQLTHLFFSYLTVGWRLVDPETV